MEKDKIQGRAPRQGHRPIENGTVVSTSDIQSVLAGQSKLLIRSGVHTKARVAAVRRQLYLRNSDTNGISPLSNGKFPVPGSSGIFLQVDLQAKRVVFLIKDGSNGSGFNFSVETFHEIEKKAFEGRVNEVLAAQSTSRTQTRIALLVAAALAGIAGFAGSHGCSTVETPETVLAPAADGE